MSCPVCFLMYYPLFATWMVWARVFCFLCSCVFACPVCFLMYYSLCATWMVWARVFCFLRSCLFTCRVLYVFLCIILCATWMVWARVFLFFVFLFVYVSCKFSYVLTSWSGQLKLHTLYL